MKSNMSGPLLIWSSILVGLQILTGGAVLGDVIGAQAAGLGILVVAALQGATQFYINGKVTPSDQVAAEVVHGEVLAGPASDQETGTPVEVLPTFSSQ